jgi:hypothetical protein
VPDEWCALASWARSARSFTSVRSATFGWEAANARRAFLAPFI